MKVFFILFCSLLITVAQSEPPSLEVAVPELLSEDRLPSYRSNLGTVHSIRIKVNPGTPQQSWRLSLAGNPYITMQSEKIPAESFPLYWKEHSSKGSYTQLTPARVVLKESLSGSEEVIFLEVVLDTDWDIFPGTYQAALHFQLESLVP